MEAKKGNEFSQWGVIHARVEPPMKQNQIHPFFTIIMVKLLLLYTAMLVGFLVRYSLTKLEDIVN